MFVIHDNVAEMLMLLNTKLTLTGHTDFFANLVLQVVFLGLVLEISQCLIVEEWVTCIELD